MKILAQNKKALFDYEILDRIEAGIVLTGEEVKSARAGHISLVGAFANIHDGELYLLNCNITPYSHAAEKKEGDPTKSRKLLVHRRQIARLVGDISRKGITLVALKVYLNERNLIKVEIGLGKHKKAAGKKEAIRERDIKRETQRELKKHR
jgi:SsrA-binding protein